MPPLHTRNDLDCWPKNSSEIPLKIDVIAATDNYLKPSTQTVMEFYIGLHMFFNFQHLVFLINLKLRVWAFGLIMFGLLF